MRGQLQNYAQLLTGCWYTLYFESMELISDVVWIWMALPALRYICGTLMYLDLYMLCTQVPSGTLLCVFGGTPLARTRPTLVSIWEVYTDHSGAPLVSIWEHSGWRQPPHPHPLIIRVPHPTPHLSPLSLPNTFTTIQTGPQTPCSCVGQSV